MIGHIKKNSKFYLFLIFFLIIILSYHLFFGKLKKEKNLYLKPISINLLTSVHPNLSWNFKPVESKIIVKPGEVINVEYIVENLGAKETTGIATFAYFPRDFGNYISKLNCFCYDAQTLKPKQKGTFTLIFLIDPKVTKDSRTKDLKEVTIQFTFFDYKEYKKKEN